MISTDITQESGAWLREKKGKNLNTSNTTNNKNRYQNKFQKYRKEEQIKTTIQNLNM